MSDIVRDHLVSPACSSSPGPLHLLESYELAVVGTKTTIRAGETLIVWQCGVVAGMHAKQLLAGRTPSADMARIVSRHCHPESHIGTLMAFDFGAIR